MNNIEKMVSVIIPAYNCERTIERCLRSLIMQTAKNMEVVVVDDGSTDATYCICRKIIEEYNNFRIIQTKNQGVSAARNIGFASTSGEYVVYVDSDDYVEPTFIEEMYTSIEHNEASLAICGYNRVRDGSRISDNYFNTIRIIDKDELADNIYELYNAWLINMPWNKMYCRSLITTGFDEKMSLGEDLVFNINYLQNVTRIVVLNKALYNYSIGNKTSLTARDNNDKFEVSMRLHLMMKDFCISKLGMEESAIKDRILIKETQYAIKRLILCRDKTVIKKLSVLKSWVCNKELKETYRLLRK